MMCGIAAGLGICVVPIMLSEIAPPHIRGSVGVMHQIAVVFGILCTQAVGMNYAVPREWRHVLSFSSAIAVVHILVGFFMEDSPVWYKGRGKREKAVQVTKRLWSGEPMITDVENMPFNDNVGIGEHEEEEIETPQKAESVLDVIMTMEYRKPLSIVSLIMIAQQVSGQSSFNDMLYHSQSCQVSMLSCIIRQEFFRQSCRIPQIGFL
jgi:MFS transporter, SP family, solute carrier family 2 (facilitated glucose transporter), member 3